jgi:hypothetical protein
MALSFQVFGTKTLNALLSLTHACHLIHVNEHLSYKVRYVVIKVSHVVTKLPPVIVKLQ